MTTIDAQNDPADAFTPTVARGNDLATIAIIGLGLIGGSLARDLAAAGVRVLGFDDDRRALRDAHREGAVHATLDERLAGVAEADVVVLALPVDAMPRALERLARVASPDALLTDVGSTKRSVVAAAESLGLGARFVGAHPFAGDHRFGWVASRRGLFVGARVFLCPAEGARAEMVERCERLWSLVGATCERMDAAEHDETLAWTSHLPHLLSTALACALDGAGLAKRELGPGGAGMVRLSGGSPALWAGIAHDNARAVDAALAGVERQLQTIRAALATGDVAALRASLVAARDWFVRDDRDGRDSSGESPAPPE